MVTKVLNFDKSQKVLEIKEDCEILGLFLGQGEDTVKQQLTIKHLQPKLKSRVLIKAVLYDQAQFDLEVKLVVAKGTEETDTYLKAQALLLGEFAQARIVPSLEISEAQVQAGHGVTIGHADQEELHYLMSRGLDEKTAEDLIVEAFVAEVKDKL